MASADASLDVLLKLVELQGKMLEGALARAAAVPQPSPVSQLKELVEVLQLASPQPTAAAPLPEGSPPWLPLIDRAIMALERINSRPAAPVAALSAGPSSPPPAEAIRVAVPRWLAPIVPYIGVICNWADTGGRPELRAQIVAEELNAETRAVLVELMAGDGFPSNIVTAIPDFQARESWMVPFLYSLRSALSPELPASLADAPASGEVVADGKSGGNGARRTGAR